MNKVNEYKVIDVQLPDEVQRILSTVQDIGTVPPLDVRTKINEHLMSVLNNEAKQGWKLHESGFSGLPMVVLYREKGVKKNVR